MGKYKIEIYKTEFWTAQMFLYVQTKEGFIWRFLETVTAKSYSELNFKMADMGWIDKLNK